jgi:nicotinate-nucleotide adenylyltransferase
MKIGIYGGTFNPVHYGHLRTAEEVYERLSLDKMLFIPSGKTPFDKPDLARVHERYEMVEKAIKGNRHFILSDVETKARGRSYSVDTIKRLSRTYENADFYFILGIDAFLDLPAWKEPEKLINLTNLVVISRPGYLFSNISALPFIKGVSKKVLSDLDKDKIPDYSFDISDQKMGHLLNVTGLTISASLVRGLISEGESIRYLLPDSVKSYIISHNLYKN